MLKLPCLALVGCTLAISLGVGTLRGAAVAADGLPANLGHDLHALVAWQRAQGASQPETERKKALAEHIRGSASRLQQDAAGRVTVNLLLDGTVPASDVKKHVESLGATVIGEHAARRADRRDGILSVRLPVERAVEAAQSPACTRCFPHTGLAAHRPPAPGAGRARPACGPGARRRHDRRRHHRGRDFRQLQRDLAERQPGCRERRFAK